MDASKKPSPRDDRSKILAPFRLRSWPRPASFTCACTANSRSSTARCASTTASPLRTRRRNARARGHRSRQRLRSRQVLSRRARAGIKPIIGCDVWLTHEAERDQPFRALLLAQSRAGYLRLAEWLTRAYRTNQHRGRAELKRDWLQEGTDGLIALSGARDGEVGGSLLQGTRRRRGEARARGRASFRGATTSKCSARVGPTTTRWSSATVRTRGRARAAGASPRIRCSSCGATIFARTRRASALRAAMSRRPAPAAAVHARAVFQDAGGDGRGVCRPPRSARELGGDRAALQPHDSARQELPARFSDAAGVTSTMHLRNEAAAGLERRLAVLYPDPATRDAKRPEYVARLEFETTHDRADGFRRLLPDRRRLHQLGEAQRRAGRPGARLRARARSSPTRSASPISIRCATASCSSAS